MFLHVLLSALVVFRNQQEVDRNVTAGIIAGVIGIVMGCFIFYRLSRELEGVFFLVYAASISTFLSETIFTTKSGAAVTFSLAFVTVSQIVFLHITHLDPLNYTTRFLVGLFFGVGLSLLLFYFIKDGFSLSVWGMCLWPLVYLLFTIG